MATTVNAYDRVQQAKYFIVEKFGDDLKKGSLGIVLGSGLSILTERLHNIIRIPYTLIPGMPQTRVAGHEGVLLLASLGGRPVICLSGRAHLYEGHSPESTVFGVRLLVALGAHTLILTNAAGGIAPECTPGTLMLISDHLNLTGQNPLSGENDSRWGSRFPDMSSIYSPSLRQLALKTATRENINLAEGIYAGMLGPSYETPAEIRMLSTLGASAVGMSTVHEAITLAHQGIPVLGLSCITNFAAGLSETSLNHEEVSRVARNSSQSFCRLVEQLCCSLHPSHS